MPVLLNPVIIIPARLASTRLPGKPLADIAGEPMIVKVWRCAMRASLGPVLVAAAEPEIAHAIERVGGRAILTDPALASGSDRICAALETADPESLFDAVINLQGDLPDIDPVALRRVMDVLQTSGADIATLAAPIADPQALATSMSLTGGCTTFTTEPYSDGVFTGFAQIGTSCGPGGGSWKLIVANTIDGATGVVISLQTASPVDQPAIDTALQTLVITI